MTEDSTHRRACRTGNRCCGGSARWGGLLLAGRGEPLPVPGTLACGGVVESRENNRDGAAAVQGQGDDGCQRQGLATRPGRRPLRRGHGRSATHHLAGTICHIGGHDRRNQPRA